MDISLVPDFMDCDLKDDSAGPMTRVVQAVNHDSAQASTCTEANNLAESDEALAENISQGSDEHEQRHINAQLRIEELLSLVQEKDRKIEQLRLEPAHLVFTRTRTVWLDGPSSDTSHLEAKIQQLTSGLSEQKDLTDQWTNERTLLAKDVENANLTAHGNWVLYHDTMRRAIRAEDELAIRRSAASAYEDRIKILETNINNLKTQNIELQSKLDAEKTVKIKPRRGADSSKVTDDEIVRLWDKMRYNIGNMASNVLTEYPSWEGLSPVVNARFGDLIDMICQDNWNLEDEENRAFMVERYIWKAVIGNVFKENGDGDFGTSWAGVAGQSFSLLIEELASTIENSDMDLSKLIHWKSEGGKMINELIGVNQQELEKLIGNLADLFVLFLPRDKNGNLRGVEKLEKGLQKVLQDAVQLQAIFMSSKAQFDVEWLHRPDRSWEDVHYHPQSMEVEGHEKALDGGSKIIFHLSPSLVKQGTADGDSYDQRIRLTKARVICD